MNAISIIDIREEARGIVEMFEGMLDTLDITVPSPEDNERGEDNTARLYGSVYGDFLDTVEGLLLRALREAKDPPADLAKKTDFDAAFDIFQESMQVLKDAFPKEKGGLKVNAEQYRKASVRYSSKLLKTVKDLRAAYKNGAEIRE